MSGNTIRRKSAVAATRGLQLLTLALVAGGVAAATLPDRSRGADSDTGEPQVPPVDPFLAEAQAPTADYEVIAANLEAWDKPPQPEPNLAEETGGAPIEEVAPPPVTRVRFLGAIMEPKRRLAVIAIDAAQKILAEGQEYDGHTVVEVGETWARISVRGVEQRIEKAKSGALLSSLSSGSPMDAQPMNLGYQDPEIQRQLAEQDEYARKYGTTSSAGVPSTTMVNPNGTTMTGTSTSTATAKAMEAMRRRSGNVKAVPVPTGAAGNVDDATGDSTGDIDADGGIRGGAATSGGSAADGTSP